MENRKLLRKRLHPVLKSALWGAAVPTVLTVCVQAAGPFLPNVSEGMLIILGLRTLALEEAMGQQPLLSQQSWAEMYLLPYAVNAMIGAVACALPAAFLEAVDYLTEGSRK